MSPLQVREDVDVLDTLMGVFYHRILTVPGTPEKNMDFLICAIKHTRLVYRENLDSIFKIGANH